MTAPTPAPAPKVDAVAAAIDAARATLAQGAQLAEPTPVEVPELAPIELVPGTDVAEQVKPDVEQPEVVEEVKEPTPEEVAAEEERRQALTIEIPEWRPGDAPLEITVETPEQAEQLRALVNSRELKSESLERLQEANQQMARVNEEKARWRVDPVGSARETLSPDQQAALALSIITDPRMLDYLRPTLEGVLTSPDALEVTRSKLEATRLRLEQEARQQVQLERAQERNIRDLRQAVEALIPPGLTAAQRRQWKADALREAADFADETRVRILDPRRLPYILAGRLQASNVDPRAAATMIDRALFTRGATDSAGSPSRPPAAPPAPTQPQRLAASAKALAAASASAPSGAGAPTAAVPPIPKGVGVKEAVKLFAKQAGVRVHP